VRHSLSPVRLILRGDFNAFNDCVILTGKSLHDFYDADAFNRIEEENVLSDDMIAVEETFEDLP
jgi:hypothetical protein